MLALEALAVGLSCAVLFLVVHAAAMAAFGTRAMTDHPLLLGQVGLMGGLFHVLCEVGGVNAWYCRQRR